MEPQNLFPQPNPNPAHPETPKTPNALRRKFQAESIKPDVDNIHVEMYAPIDAAPAPMKEDYLNKISATPTKPKLFSGKLLILAAAIVVMFVAVVAAAIASGGNKVQNASGEVLGQRIINLRDLTAYGRNNGVSGSEVNRVMDELDLVLASRTNDLTGYYLGRDGKTNTFTTPTQEVAAAYSLDTVKADLDKAKANSNLNNTYLEALRTQLADTETLIEKLYDTSQSQELKAALNQTYVDLTALSDRLPKQAASS